MGSHVQTAKMLQSSSFKTPGRLQLRTTTGLHREEQITRDTLIHYLHGETEQTTKIKRQNQHLFESRERSTQLQGSEGLA